MAFDKNNLYGSNFEDLPFLQDNNSNSSDEKEKKLQGGFQYVIEISNNGYKIKNSNIDIVLNPNSNQELFNSLNSIIKKIRDKGKISSNQSTTIYINLGENGQIIDCEVQSGSSNERKSIELSDETKNDLQKCLHGIQRKCDEKRVSNSKSINQ
ncbi:hypothetical protein [Spiroplasma endosymbiont of Virgichneumon dumeticola]|uniref:hypothetical protein n=1 Tax=Spiroplasma endosymbiont of Virgichneumon dumeticola TaxID=3139323 RepID=UPI0035C8E298